MVMSFRAWLIIVILLLGIFTQASFCFMGYSMSPLTEKECKDCKWSIMIVLKHLSFHLFSSSYSLDFASTDMDNYIEALIKCPEKWRPKNI
jgi:hypothetical protein